MKMLVLLLLATVLGCQHAKPKQSAPIVQEYGLPPDEPRFNNGPSPIGPSGRHFLALVRDATYIRLPAEDGEYLVNQVKTRAGPQKGE